MKGRIALATMAALVVLALWVGIQAALAFLVKPGENLAVFGPENQVFISTVSAGGTVIRTGRYFVIARSDDEYFVPKLYRAGALLVVNARAASGCLTLTRIRGFGK